MRLKKHREDVKFLQSVTGMADHIWEIAERYRRLILAFEAYLNMNSSYFQHKDKVLKDAGVK